MTPRIINGLRTGEPGALGELFDDVGEDLFQHCWLMLHSCEAALTVVRDTLIVAHAHIGRLRDPGQLRPWLYALARTECQHRTSDEPEEAVLLLNAAEDEARLVAWSAVMSLPPAEREILDLTARRGMSVRDAGLVTGLGADAASLIEQARASLQQAMVAGMAAHRSGAVSGKVSPAKVYARLPWPPLPPGARADILACFTSERRAAEVAVPNTGVASTAPDGLPVASTAPDGWPVASTVPDGLPALVSPVRITARRRIAVGLLAAASALSAAVALALVVLSLPGSIWSAPPAGSAAVAPTRDVAHAGSGERNTRPTLTPSDGPTGRAPATPGFGHGLGPGPGTGNATALYLAITRPQPSRGPATGDRGVGHGSQGGQPPGSQPGPVPSTTPVPPPPPAGSPVPSESGSPSPSGSASPSPSRCRPSSSVSPSASASPSLSPN